MKGRAVVGFVLVILFLVSLFSMSVYSGASDFNSGSGFSVAQSTVDWWPMFHHDLTHTGHSTSTVPNTNQTLWNYTTGLDVESSPAVADGIVYVGSWDGNVYGLNASTGALIWNYTTESYVESSPAVAGGAVFVGSTDGNFYALNASTGALIWTYASGEVLKSSPAVADGIVYVGSYGGKVFAFGSYSAVPEFPSFLVLSLLMIISSFFVAFRYKYRARARLMQS